MKSLSYGIGSEISHPQLAESRWDIAMPSVFEFKHKICQEEIDGLGHANNIAYLQWLQAAALAHSAEQGWKTSDYKQRGWSWVVRSHFIEYRRPVFADELIIVKTWVADMKKFSSLRKYEILHGETGKLIARAETNWAFVTTESGRLVPIPEEVSSAFEIIDPPKASIASQPSSHNTPEEEKN